MFYRTEVGGRNKHRHIVYYNPDTGALYQTSEKEGHTHPVELVEQATMAPDGSVQAFKQIVVGVGTGKQKHDHGLLNIEQEFFSERSEKKENEDEVFRMAWSYFKELKEYNNPWKEKYALSLRYHKRDMWKPGDKNALDNQGRPHIEVNLCRPTVWGLLGNYLDLKTDFLVMPIEGGDTQTADVLNKLLKYISETTNLSLQEIFVAKDKMLAGLGVYYFYVSDADNVAGDIKIIRVHPDKVFLGPHERHDLSDMEVMAFTQWFSASKIRQLYPEKWDDIEAKTSDLGGGKKEPHKDGNEVSYDDEGSEVDLSDEPYTDTDMIDTLKKKYRVVDLRLKEYIDIPVFMEIVPGADTIYIPTFEYAQEDVSEIKTIEELKFYNKKDFRIRRIEFGGNCVLLDDYPDKTFNGFPIIVDFCEDCGKDIDNKLTDVIPMNDLVNKSLSQGVDILSKMYNFMWLTFPQTFETPKELEEFKQCSARPGYVAVVNPAFKPEKVETHTYPAGLERMVDVSVSLLSKVSMHSPSLAIDASREMSGKAMLEMKRNNLSGNRIMFELSNNAKQTLGKILINLGTKVISPERMARIINNQDIQEAVRTGAMSWEEANQIQIEPQYSPEQIEKIWNNIDVTKYDVKVYESPYNPTVMQANYEMTADLAKQGVPVPPEVMIEASNLPYKGKIKSMIAQQRQAEQQIEQGKQQTEITKTMIAKGNQGPGASAPGNIPMGGM